MDTTRRTARAPGRGTRIAIFVAALLALAAHPARAQSGAEDETLSAPRSWELPARLQVQSNHWLDLHLYLVRDGMVRSLGVVNGPGRSELALPADATMPGSLVQILVEPIGGGGSWLSNPLIISPGDRVDLTVQNNLGLSSESVGRR